MTLAHDSSSHPGRDQITISGITATGRHGVLSSERESGQKFSVDLTLGLALGDAAAGDDLDKTVNYAHIAEATASVIEGSAVNLIETLAERIAAVTLENELVESVAVTVHKPQAPIPVPFGSVAVTVRRSRTNPARVSRPFAQEDAETVDTLPNWRDVDSVSPVVDADTPSSSETAASPVSAVATAFAGPVVASVSPSVAVSPAPIPTSNSITSAQEAFDESEAASDDERSSEDENLEAGFSSESVEPAADEAVPAESEVEAQAAEAVPAEPEAHNEDELESTDAEAVEEPAEATSASSTIVATTEVLEEVPTTGAPAAEESDLSEAEVVEEPAELNPAQQTVAAETSIEQPETEQYEDEQPETQQSPAEPEAAEPSTVALAEVPALEEDLPEPTVEETTRDSAGAPVTHAVPVLENVPSAASPVVGETPVSASTPEPVATPALEADEEVSTRTTQFAALSESLGVSDASGYPWHQAQSNTVPSGPTLSELLGGSQDDPLDLSKPLFAMGAPKSELPPLPKPFFEAQARQANTPAASTQQARSTAAGASPATQVSAQTPQAPAALEQKEWTPPVFAFDTPAEQTNDLEPLPSRPESAQSAPSSDSAFSPDASRSASSAPSADQPEFAPPVSAASPSQPAPAETAADDGAAAGSSESLETGQTTKLSPSAQQRLEERFAAMMSEHFGINVGEGDAAPTEAAGTDGVGLSAASAAEPATTASAIPLVLSQTGQPGQPGQPDQPAQPQTPSSPSPSAQSPAPSLDNAPTQIIPVIVPDEPEADLSRGGTAIIEPAARPERAPAVQPEASLNTSMFKTLDQMDEIPQSPVRVVLALGANLGDAQETLNAAVKALGEMEAFDVVKVGPLALTAAVGGPDQNDFYNSVVIAETTLSPRELLHATQAIENAHNRTREVHWGPRTLDIDIITYGMLVASAEDLELPHPRAKERAFVLVPWEEADREAVLPGLGGGPVSALAATAPDRSGVRWLALNWLT